MILSRQPWQQLPFGLRSLPKDKKKKKKMRESRPRNKGPVSYTGQGQAEDVVQRQSPGQLISRLI